MASRTGTAPWFPVVCLRFHLQLLLNQLFWWLPPGKSIGIKLFAFCFGSYSYQHLFKQFCWCWISQISIWFYSNIPRTFECVLVSCTDILLDEYMHSLQTFDIVNEFRKRSNQIQLWFVFNWISRGKSFPKKIIPC